ncbi:MAG: trk system potassium uptake protein TrkA [Alphaproteobacteria bacterium]|jgi:trk system potassium uptake protein TrkA
MKSIVIGAGDVGLNIARHLVMENRDVVVVDSSLERLQLVNETLDVQTIHGKGAHPDVLEQAGAGNADMIIAVTQSDEVNMVACQMAYSLFNVPKKIARVRHSSYLNLVKGHLFTPDNMPVDVIISPEAEVADSIIRNLDIPGAFDSNYFAEGEIALIGVNIQKNSPVVNIALKDLTNSADTEFVAVAIYRGGRGIIPRGSDHIEGGDEVFFVCRRADVADVMNLFGFESQKKVRSVFVIGGGFIGYEVCKRLVARGIKTRVIESNKERAMRLAEQIDDITVIHGSAVDRDLYEQENVGQMDAVLAITNDDAANILASVMAKQVGAKMVVTRINEASYMPLIDSLGLHKVVSPLEITASRILQHVRRGFVHSLHTIHEGKAQVIEAQVTRTSKIVGSHVVDIDLPEGVTIAAIFNAKKGMILPREMTIVREGDRVIFFSAVEQISEVDDLF